MARSMAQDTPAPVLTATAATAPLAQHPTPSSPHVSTETSANAPPDTASTAIPAGADGGGTVESIDRSIMESRLGQVRAGCLPNVITGRLRAGRRVLAIQAVVAKDRGNRPLQRPLTSRPYKAGMGHAGFSPDQARNPQARSAVMCSASRMKGELHPTKTVQPRVYYFFRSYRRLHKIPYTIGNIYDAIRVLFPFIPKKWPIYDTMA